MAYKKNGFHFPYMIEETTDKGLGVFAGKAIRQGSIVWRHVPGQYVVYDEQTFKALIAKMSRADVVYQLTHVFGLKDFHGVLIRILDGGALINHSRKAKNSPWTMLPTSLNLHITTFFSSSMGLMRTT